MKYTKRHSERRYTVVPLLAVAALITAGVSPHVNAVAPNEFFGNDADVLARFEFNGALTDSSGNGRDIVALGTGGFEAAPWGQGVRIADTDPTGLSWTQHASLIQHPYTIEVVMTPENLDGGGWRKIFSFDDADDNGWYYYNTGGQWAIQDYPNRAVGAGAIEPGVQHYIAFVSTSPTSVEVYLQGELLGETETTFAAPPTEAIFFRDDSDTGRYEQFVGVVDALRISSVARTAEEILATYERVATGPVDSDGDGIMDDDETNIYGTDPGNPDTDGDGLSDGAEVFTHGTDPLNADTDGDGLDDGAEVNTHGTDPLSADTDGDGLTDGFEIGDGTCTDPLKADSDGDGLSDGDEASIGTDACLADSDGDGLADGDEVNTHFTDPTNADTDGDGLGDGDEIHTHGTDPLAADTDGDCYGDGAEVTGGSDPLDPASIPTVLGPVVLPAAATGSYDPTGMGLCIPS